MTYALKPIPADFANRGWKVLIDGEEVRASKVELVSPRWGHLTYGLRPEGFDSWNYVMKENAVTIPYCVRGFWKKRLIVGLLRENRPNMGGEALCVIGGFTDPGETLAQAQKRELDEEASLVGHARQLGGQMVTDRLFWDASQEGFGGNLTFVQKISPRELVRSSPREWGVSAETAAFKDFKKAQFLTFMEWGDAVERTRDGIALAALARVRNAFDLGLL